MSSNASETRLGIVMGVGAYSLWGVLPLLIRVQHPVTPPGILAHRIIWSMLVLIGLAFLLKRWPAVRAALGRPRTAWALCASTLVIGFNWLLYIHAVNSGQVVQASLGYFINPLVNVLLGMIVLRERLGRPEIAAVLLAAAGVAALTIDRGTIPYIPLGLAFSFGLYGLIRKMIGIGPIEGLLIETGLMVPMAAFWLMTRPILPPGEAGPPLLLLIAAGTVTIAPLLLFAGAANRIRYSELGLLQYIGPTIQMLLAVAVFGERLLPIHLLTFGLIWSGLIIYVIATWHRGRATPAMPE